MKINSNITKFPDNLLKRPMPLGVGCEKEGYGVAN